MTEVKARYRLSSCSLHLLYKLLDLGPLIRALQSFPYTLFAFKTYTSNRWRAMWWLVHLLHNHLLSHHETKPALHNREKLKGRHPSHTGNHNKRPSAASQARQPKHLSVSWPENVDVTTKLQFQFTCLFDALLSHMTTHWFYFCCRADMRVKKSIRPTLLVSIDWQGDRLALSTLVHLTDSMALKQAGKLL